MKKHAIIPIFIPHIGCSESCVFCDQKQITARSGAPTIDQVRETIDTWLATLTGPAASTSMGETPESTGTIPSDESTEIEIAFYGGSFTAIPIAMQERYLSCAKEYIDRGLVSGLHISTRPDAITPEILDMLANYGVRAIELGVQSFDDEVLRLSKRGHDSETVRNACRMIREHRRDCRQSFRLGIQLMVGLPGDSMESCIYSANEAVKLKPDLARLYPTLVLEGTELMDMYQSGAYTPLSREEALARTKAMYQILDDAGIYIMRVGLKSTDIINSENLGEINGGTYHPAFRQLVEGAIARDRIELLIEEVSGSRNEQLTKNVSTDVSSKPTLAHSTKAIEIRCAPGWISNAAGHNGINRKYFEEKYPCLRLSFTEDAALHPGEFSV